jgi:hypothetical protein
METYIGEIGSRESEGAREGRDRVEREIGCNVLVLLAAIDREQRGSPRRWCPKSEARSLLVLTKPTP